MSFLVGGAWIVPSLADGIELVEEKDRLLLAGVGEDPAQVVGGFPQVRRNNSIEPRVQQMKSELCGDNLRAQGLAAAGLANEQEPALWCEPVTGKICLGAELIDDPLQTMQHFGRLELRSA